jgi:DNA-binding GntR family transcriptional regulator
MLERIIDVNEEHGQTNKPIDAYHRIKDLIVRQILNPGQKLPYRDLAEMIGMSKTPIISALNRLVYEGLAVYEVNKGYAIKPIDEEEISELFEIRIQLETFNVRNAIKRFTRESFEKLKDKFTLLSEYNPSFTDRKKLFLDMDFHLQIARMGGNPYSHRFLRTAIENIFLRYRIERGVESRKEDIEAEHRQVLECVAGRDTQGAVEELHKLMLQYLRTFRSGLGSEWF